MSQKDNRDLDAPTPPGSPMRRDEPDQGPDTSPDTSPDVEQGHPRPDAGEDDSDGSPGADQR